MNVRLAYAFVRILFMLELLLFAASLLLHLSVFITGPNEFYAKYGLPLFRRSVIVGLPVMGFVKDGKWMAQIKSCPKWMWRAALAIGVYALLTVCLQVIFPQGGGALSEQAMTVSGFPLGFEAIHLCVLYSVLWCGYLEKSEVIRRALYSAVFVTLTVIAFLAFRAGYLHNPKTN